MSESGKPARPGSSHNLTRGLQGEELAVRHLMRLGYRIICRNYRCPLGEVDIIAQHRGALVFVEVKSRSSTAFGSPKLAITPAKQHKLSQVAWHYLQKYNLTDTSARFDVVTISDMPSTPHLEVIQNAFESTY